MGAAPPLVAMASHGAPYHAAPAAPTLNEGDGAFEVDDTATVGALVLDTTRVS